MEWLSEVSISTEGIRHILPLCSIHVLLKTQITVYLECSLPIFARKQGTK